MTVVNIVIHRVIVEAMLFALMIILGLYITRPKKK